MSEKTLDGLTPEQAIAKVEQILGHTFEDRPMIEAAITHPSAVKHTATTYNYERLEFLGDSILGAIVAIDLFKRYPDLEEGGLTRIKVSLVAGSMLSQVASDIGLADVIIFGDSETGTDRRGLHSALENVYEATVAALYLDAGMEVARAWVAKTLLRYVSKDMAAEPENPKSSLQELLQAHQKRPCYEITGMDGPPHDRTFFAQVSIDGKVVGTGQGHSKKEAEANAAAAALKQRDWMER